MTDTTRLNALTIDVIALEGVVRALIVAETERSRSSLTAVLQALETEAANLGRAAVEDRAETSTAAAAVIGGWIEAIKDRALAA